MSRGRHPKRTRRGSDGEGLNRKVLKAERRQELLDSAVETIRTHGPDASMEQIARQAGISKPIVYRHFGDRQGLSQAVAARFVDDLLQELRQALAQEAEPRQVLVATIDAYLAFVERDPHIYTFLVHRAERPEAGVTLAGFMRQISQEVASVLGEALRSRGQDSGAAEPWAHALVGMVHLAGDWWVERRTMPRARLVEYLTQLVWDGLGSLALDPAEAAAEAAR